MLSSGWWSFIMFKKNRLFIFLCLFFAHSSFAYVKGSGRYELGFGAEIPFYIGMQARYNWSTQVYTRVGGGFAMELLMNARQQFLESAGFEQRKSLTDSLSNSFVVDARLGWTRSVYSGSYLELGYTLMLWGRRDYRIHGPAFHIGYRFILIDKLTFNLDLGLYKPLFKWAHGFGKNENRIGDSDVNSLWFISMGTWLGFGF